MSNSNKQKIYLVSFADTRLGISICRFKQQAEAMHIFDDIFIYTEASLPLSFKEDFNDKFYSNYRQALSTGEELIPTRGFGYWCWKPKVILMTLEQIKKDDILIFLDIGFEFYPEKRDELLDMIAQANENEIMGLDMGIHLEKSWNKMDLLLHYNLQDDSEFLNSSQLASGMIFCKKTSKSQSIIQEWLDAYYHHYNLIDDSESIAPNLPEFRENRHDQSIWSIINKREKLNNFSPNFYHKRNGEYALSYNRNKIYLPNSYKNTKAINEFIRQTGVNSLQYQSIHYNVLEHILKGFGLLDQYKKWFDNFIKSNSNNFNNSISFAQLEQSQEIIRSISAKINEINSLPIQQQILQVENLKQDLIIKQLEAKKLEKELGTRLENIQEISSLKEEINKKDKAIKEFSDRLSAQEASLKSTNESLRKKDLEIKNLEITSQNIKNHLSYKLGNALIQAHKQWYKGGYIKFIFEAIKIKKEHNKTKI
ncbi:hypothetical protein [Campylobacter devanensis]|uniref:hypothetical protein n=1 Tax=Campylobacter devanensis TaxID=3161138 RepID=UPI0015D6A69F|nr:hypothetical protein [Campylobacter sp. P0136]